MQKKLSHLFEKYSLLILLILLIPSFISLIRPGFYPMQDDLQAFRLHQMDQCINDLQIPCRWIPDMGYQYGYPQFNFYSPGVYYLGEVFHLLGMQFIDVVKVLFILGFIISGVGMYYLVKSITNSSYSAVIAGVLYTYAPFKAAQVYVRGSLSEFFAFAIFPFIFLTAYKYVKDRNPLTLIYFSLSVSALLLTHNLMSMLFLPIATIWVLTLVLLEKKPRLLINFFLSGLLGFGLAAFFVLPLVFERQFVHVETLLGGYFDYRQHFVNLQQLFFSNYFGYGSSVLGDADEVTLSTGILHWILATAGLVLSAIYFKKNKRIAIIAAVISICELTTLFLMHQKSSMIWSNLTILHWLQFPWRLLSISTFLLSILGGISIYLITKFHHQISIFVGVIIVIGLLILHGTNFSPKDWYDISDKEKFSGESWEKQLTISIFDYLPIYAKLPPNHKAPPEPEITDGQAAISGYTKGSNWQRGRIEVMSQDAVVRLPLFDFPGMQVYVNGKAIDHDNKNCKGEEYCFGLISVWLPKGIYEMKVQLENTLIRSVGNSVTLLSFITLVVLGGGYLRNSKGRLKIK